MFSIALVVSTRLSNKFNQEKINSLNEEKEKQDGILSDVLKVATLLDHHSLKVYEIVEEMVSSIENITISMSNIAKGASNTADSIQEQSQLTNEIQATIVDTSNASNNMEKISLDTIKAVLEGINIVDNLSSKSTVFNEKSENVFQAMLNLKEKSNEIQSITNIITGISEQTNLLSLNASIESARAGEAGQGFKVVAEEIRKLAMQSKESANNIGTIIAQLVEKADQSVEAVKELKTVSKEQSDLVTYTKNIFGQITSKMQEVNNNINTVTEKIEQILTSNDQIVERINDISAVSEETTASAQETNSMTEENIERANTAKTLVQELMDISKEMNKYSN
jgi:methyl-accepting chemotaxis protein